MTQTRREPEDMIDNKTDNQLEQPLVPSVSNYELSLATPEQDTNFAHVAAKQLMQIVKANGWSRNLGGQSDHLQFEAWQTVGKYYSLAVDTDQQPVEYVELGGVWGFKAHAQAVDTKTGMRVGGASAFCMSDEPNWKSKPKFQLASMAQTRAGSKALRQILAFVVALAGFNPTPLEEMTKDTEEWLNKPQPNEIRGEVVTAHEVEKPISAGFVCVRCDKDISEKVAKFSMDKYQKTLCFDCQKLENK